MIKKMSSQDYNNILSDSINKIETVYDEMQNIKDDIYKKIKIIEYEKDYLSYLQDRIDLSSKKEDTFIFLNNGRYNGIYSAYSNAVHAYFKQTPINVFNLKVINGTKTFFRDEVTVKINGIEDSYFKNILKADAVEDKNIFFEEYKFNDIIEVIEKNGDKVLKNTDGNFTTLTVEVEDSKILGISKFNIIEIDPYLYKSFDIKAIKIFTDNLEEPSLTLNDLKSVGKTRFLLNKKYDLRKVEFIFDHNYHVIKDNEKIFPFGLKHLFFLEGDFRNDSFIVADYSSDEYIDDINDKIKVYTTAGQRLSSLTEENIKIYLSINNGVLENEQMPSNEIKKPIARNIKDIYFHIPLSNEGIIGYEFEINKR